MNELLFRSTWRGDSTSFPTCSLWCCGCLAGDGHDLVDERAIRGFATHFCKTFLHIFTQPDFALDETLHPQFVDQNSNIATVLALSTFRTSDPYLELLRWQGASVFKILAIYNSRCQCSYSAAIAT